MLEHISYHFSDEEKILNNPIITGFPIYGIGGLIIIYLNYYLKTNNVFIIFLLSAILLTLAELITGYIVKAGELGENRKDGKIISWDYSKNFLNYKGIIDLKHFIGFGILGTIIVLNYDKMYSILHKLFV